MERGYCMTCKAPAYSETLASPAHVHHRKGCHEPLEHCDGSCGGPPDHLEHLVLSWAARGLLTMSEGWRDRRVLMSGKSVNEATDEAAHALHEQGLIEVVDYGTIMLAAGAITVTDEGRIQLDQWDRLAAGAG